MYRTFRACAVVLRVKTQDYSRTKPFITSWREWSDFKIQLVSIPLSLIAQLSWSVYRIVKINALNEGVSYRFCFGVEPYL